MSDILIRGIEMPTEEQSVITINIYSDGIVTCYDDDVERKAIPVPEHGRLIDADALTKSDRMVGKLMMFDGEYVYTQAEINRAPTIIPAGESEI